MKFKMEIEFGSEAMQGYQDLADVLAKLSRRFDSDNAFGLTLTNGAGKLRDLNGNTVGEWSIDE